MSQPNPEVAMVQRVLEGGLETYTTERIGLILRTVAPKGTTPDELALYLAFCQARDLNPLMKQVYLAKDKTGRLSIMTGIDGLRLLAQRSGEYEGQVGPEWKESKEDPWDDVPPEDRLYACRVGVWRTGFKLPIWGTVRFTEFARDEPWAVNWRDRPSHMLAIRAESHALRKAFPAETAGVTVHYEGGVAVEPSVQDPDAPVTYPQLGMLHGLAKKLEWSRAERLGRAGVDSFTELTRGRASELIEEWKALLDPRGELGAGAADPVPADPDPAPAQDVTAEGADTAEVPLSTSSAVITVEEAPGLTTGDAPAAASSRSVPQGPPTNAGDDPVGGSSARHVQGAGGTGRQGKAPRATRPADTPEVRAEKEAPAPGPEGSVPSGQPVAGGSTVQGSEPEMTPPNQPADNADPESAAPATSSLPPHHEFEGEGLVCSRPDCELLPENKVHRGVS